MIDLCNINESPTLDDIIEYVRNPVFGQFCSEIKEKYGVQEKLEFSKCSMEPGWNVKFKKSGKALCTIYPRENYFAVMVVVGRKEKEPVERILPDCVPELQQLYEQTTEGNGQRWLMIDMEDTGALYEGVMRLIDIRVKAGAKA